MAAVAFDPLEYTRKLEESGVPRAQAEVHARAMTAMFLHNFDALVTKDYLDVRLSEFEIRLESRLDKRIDERFASLRAELEKRFSGIESRLDKMDQRFDQIDKRFVESDKRFGAIEKRFVALERRFAEIDKRFSSIDVRLERMEGRFNLLYWMQGLTIAVVVAPLIRSFAG